MAPRNAGCSTPPSVRRARRAGPGRGDAGRAPPIRTRRGPRTGSGCSPAHTPWPGRVPSRSARTTRPRCCPNTWTRRSRDPPGGRPQGGPTGGQRLRPSPSSCQACGTHSADREDFPVATPRPRAANHPAGRARGFATSSPWTATQCVRMLPDPATRGCRRRESGRLHVEHLAGWQSGAARNG